MGGCLFATVSGEIDYVTGPVFRLQIKELIAGDDRCIVLDLSGVTFCDSAGLNVLIGGWRMAAGGCERGCAAAGVIGDAPVP